MSKGVLNFVTAWIPPDTYRGNKSVVRTWIDWEPFFDRRNRSSQRLNQPDQDNIYHHSKKSERTIRQILQYHHSTTCLIAIFPNPFVRMSLSVPTHHANGELVKCI